jgi:hypothetical protein
MCPYSQYKKNVMCLTLCNISAFIRPSQIKLHEWWWREYAQGEVCCKTVYNDADSMEYWRHKNSVED